MTPLLLLTALLTGLLGSVHCSGMCGGLLAAVSGRLGRSPAGTLSLHGGRLVSYTALGILSGFLGSLLAESGPRISSVVATLSGLLVFTLGLEQTGWIPRWSLLRDDLIGRLPWIGKGLDRLLGLPGPLAHFAIGAGQALLPCSLLYGALLAALGSRSPLLGGAVVALFALGISTGLSGRLSRLMGLKERQRQILLWAGGFAMAALGLIILFRP